MSTTIADPIYARLLFAEKLGLTTKKYIRLDKKTLADGVRYLCQRDADIDAVVRRLGPPPLWLSGNDFSNLLLIILEQQVSLASARATFARLKAKMGNIEPAPFLLLADDELRAVGFSRQKTRYGRELAEAIAKGRLELRELEKLDDAEVRERLIAIKGIGRWTAEIYLLMILGRPDAWPVGDIALVRAVREVKSMEADPDAAELEQVAQVWRPWRSVAARVLWLHYLNR